MDVKFPEMAAAIRELVRIGLISVERLAATGHVSDIDLDMMRRQKVAASAAAALLEQLGRHEALVLNLAAVGGLMHFPEFTTDTADLRAGSIALMRSLVTVDLGPECMVKIINGRLSTTVTIDRRDIIGLEKPPNLAPLGTPA